MNTRLVSLSLVAAQLLWLSSAALSPVLAATTKNEDSDSSSDKISDKDAKALLKAIQEQQHRMDAQEKRLSDQEKALADQRKALVQEKLQFEKLQTQFIAVTGKPLPAASAKPVAAADQTPVTTKPTKAPEEVGTERKEAKEKPPEVAAIIDEGGVLTKKGKIVFTPAIEYDRSSATSVEVAGFSIIPALNIGLFDISRVNRDIVTPSIDLRYGLTNRFEIETKVPYVYRADSTLQRPVGVPGAPETLTSVTGNNIGDVEVAAHYQINNGQQGWPFFIGNLRFKTATGTSPFEVPVVNGLQQELPTGSGFYALQPSITAIYPSDPVVYYGNLGYLHNFGRSFSGYGRIDGGDAISGSFGMSLSLNDKSSFSVGYSHTMVLKTMQNGSAIANSDVLQVGSVDLGYSYNLTDATNLNFSISGGVTSDAPDVRLIFRVPMTFDLF